MKRVVYFLVLFIGACNSEVVEEQAQPEASVVEDEISDTMMLETVDGDSSVTEDSSLRVEMVSKFDNGIVIRRNEVGNGDSIRQGDIVKFHYKLINERNEKLDDSYKLGYPVAIKQGLRIVPQGLDFALTNLSVGDKARITVPPALGFGEEYDNEFIHKGENIYYEIEVKDNVTAIDLKGVKLYVFHYGGGTEINEGDMIGIDYFAYLENGDLFDSSRKGDGPFEFPVGKDKVMKGLDVAVQNMKVGDKAYIEIDSEMAYGSKGLVDKVPPNSDLVYMVSLDYRK